MANPDTIPFQTAAIAALEARIAAKAPLAYVPASEPDESPDLTIYFGGGRMVLVEFMRADGDLSATQRDRVLRLRRLGLTVHIISALTGAEAVDVLNPICAAELLGHSTIHLPSAYWLPL